MYVQEPYEIHETKQEDPRSFEGNRPSHGEEVMNSACWMPYCEDFEP